MLDINRLAALSSSWGKSPQVIRSIGSHCWEADDCKNFLRRVCGTISDNWLRVLIDGRYIFHKDLLHETGLTTRDETRVVSFEKVENFLEKGATVVVRRAQSYFESAFDLYELLARRFNCHISCNLYTSKANGVGFKEHFDTHHILVLQLQGSKTWLVSPTIEPRSSKLVPPQDQRASRPGDRLEFLLKAGDFLYLPRGCGHSAKPGTDGSTHLSFGVHVPTLGELHVEEAKKIALGNDFMVDQFGFDSLP